MLKSGRGKQAMKAVILAGGKGTRLAEYTREIPKPMLKIGGKSILEHQIDLLIKYNVDDIIILVNYLKDIIINQFGDGSTYGVKIRYFEENKPLGTVGGIKEVEDWLDEDFLVLLWRCYGEYGPKKTDKFPSKKIVNVHWLSILTIIHTIVIWLK
ncbi:MAG: nucleotidyltransferase family protein [Bacteroidales bacterium]|nr:nucleotidyltransferase family protein [Bacteroidales bacterium]